MNGPEYSWDTCPGHEWDEVESMHSNEWHTQVRCRKCCMTGERDEASGEVFWPAT